MISLIGIFVTLALLMFLVFKRLNIVIVSILCSIVISVLNKQDILSTLTNDFMIGATGYFKSFFLLFIVSALFGKIMEETGAASSIAIFLVEKMGRKLAIIGVVIAGAILCYGGISALVIAFTMYPIALAMFKEANLPRHLIPGAIAAGCFTFAAAAFPGTPQTINVIATTYLGTSVSAAPIVGLICGVIGMLLSCFYLYRKGLKAQQTGETFQADEKVTKMLESASILGSSVNPIIAISPIVCIIIMLVVLKLNVIVSMFLGSLLCGILFFKNVKEIPGLLRSSVEAATNAAVTTGCIVGYGSVVSSSPGFAYLADVLLALKSSPLLSFGLATSILSGAAGSGTGGLAITLESMAPKYLELGLNPEILHRVGTLSAIGLDTLPHNGAVVVLLTLCGMTHKESYKPIFVVSVLFTFVIMLIAIVLGTIFYPV